MVFALLGLTAIQAIWIKKGMENRVEAFDRSVSDALSTCANEINDMHKAQGIFFAQTYQADELQEGNMDLSDIIPEEYLHPDSPVFIDIIETSNADGDQVREIWINDSMIKAEIISIIDTHFQEQMGGITYEFDVHSSYEGVVQGISENGLGNPLPIEERITEDQLVRILQTSLENNGIHASFEYALFDLDNEEDVYSTLSASEETQLYTARIYPDIFMEYHGQLSLFIPKKKGILFNQMWPFLGASSLFLIAILAIFLITLRIIFRQQKLSELKTDFINNMTHELKTPVSTIGLATEMLGKEKVLSDSEKVKSYSSLISDETKRLNSQIERVLQAARLEKGDLRIDKEPVDFHDILDQVEAKVIIHIERDHGELKSEKTASNHIIQGDKEHLVNVMYNLIDNALKYKKDVPRIEIRSWNAQKGLYISVNDQGIGMSKAVLGRIFEKFYRVPTGNVHNVKGFGLGLNYVKTMVEHHDGKVTVDSTPGVGSTFTLYFEQS